ncbi:glycosyltransferase family 4 protein [Niastella caeni]|uniref:Glycosyltransferase family 4 protein n=1 Tax=Niastella caeni TaxID=2569763 RepID=A0A4S8HV25_9BACT|nr:glycosyltransferase [Niastella caeni]THU39457.1 glycosyltransferase family 4 protein [Niastella caeni]
MKAKQVKLASLVSYKILPPVLGGQKGIALFNKYISRHASFTCIATRNNDPQAAEYEVLNILSNSPLRYINPFYFFTIRKIIRQRQITHLLLEHPYYGWLALLLKWFTGVRLVVHSHNIEGLRWKTLGKWWWKIMWLYEKQVHKNAHYNFFIHEDDRLYAIEHFKLQPQRCLTITFGIEWNTPPSPAEKEAARNTLLARYNIPADHCILFFNGAFDYPPNLDALERIIQVVLPALQKKGSFKYTILICGKNIPPAISELSLPNFITAGFVDDITVYFKGADIFLNPITEGGGIKTKLVEALGFNLSAVSTSHGAIGVDAGICNGKLQLTDDIAHGFVEKIMQLATNKKDIPPAFYDHFYWDNIAQKAIRFIEI